MVSYPLKNRAQKSAIEWFTNTLSFVAACSIKKVLEHISTIFANVVQMMYTVIVFNHITIGKSVERLGQVN